MSEFTASNGVTIRYMAGIDGAVRLIGTSLRPSGDEWTDATASPEGIEALREFFRAEDDKRLGRWRSTIDAAWTAVVQADSGYVFFRHDDGECGFTVAPDRSNMPSWSRELQEVAREYFDAHPEPKPWWGADVDEAWELTANGDTGPFVTKLTPAGTIHFVAGNGTEFIAEASDITAGRRIYPEVAS